MVNNENKPANRLHTKISRKVLLFLIFLFFITYLILWGLSKMWLMRFTKNVTNDDILIYMIIYAMLLSYRLVSL